VGPYPARTLRIAYLNGSARHSDNADTLSDICMLQ